jgi:Domain of unknown function (DUF4296)
VKNVFLLAVLLLAFSCKSEEEIPEGILTEQEMVDILIDIIEGKVGVLSVGKDSSRVLFVKLERDVFEKHKMDSLVYRKSYQYYMTHPELYLNVNDIVLDSLKIRQDRIDPSELKKISGAVPK